MRNLRLTLTRCDLTVCKAIRWEVSAALSHSKGDRLPSYRTARSRVRSSPSPTGALTCKSRSKNLHTRFTDRFSHSDGTIDYQARQHQIDFVLSPYYDADNLDFADGLKTLQLAYRDTLLYTERESQKTTGLDALGVRQAETLSPPAINDPPMPIAPSNGHLAVDAEGLALNADGTYVPLLLGCDSVLMDSDRAVSGSARNMDRTST